MIRVVSWNIRAGGGRRVEHIAAQLHRWRSDVVALQEFRATAPSRWLSRELGKLGLVHQRTTASAGSPTANGILVASRWPLRGIYLATAPEKLRRWTLVKVVAPQPFTLGAMHVPNRASGQKYPFHASVLAVARDWQRGPVMLVGDTNTGRIGLDEEVPVFSHREDRWMQALEEAGWRDAFRHVYRDSRVYTWYSPNGHNGFRLDEAFVHQSLLPRLVDARYSWGFMNEGKSRRDALSDHAAIIVDLVG